MIYQRPTFMRYVIETAGNVEYIIKAVEITKELKAPQAVLWEEFNKRVGLQKKSIRFAEPHFSFAKELSLISNEQQDCTEEGRALLAAYNKTLKKPIFILVYQFLKNDASFFLPYLRFCLNSGILPNGKQIHQQIEMARKSYESLLSYYGKFGTLFIPPLKKKISERTLKHHVLARNRFLFSEVGLNLNNSQTERLMEKFNEFAYTNLPDDAFHRLGEVMTDKRPDDVEEDFLHMLIKEAYSKLKLYKLASAKGAFLYVNQLLLPNKAVQFSIFRRHLKDHGFKLEPSFDRDDFLFAPKEELK